MIVAYPNTLSGHIGAVLSALIIVASAIGLTMNADVYAGMRRKDFFCYFTNLSNLLVLGYFALAAPVLHARSALRRYIPLAEFSVSMSIMLTHVVFHFLILPHARKYTKRAESGAQLRILAVNTLFVHYLVPWLTFAYWLLCSPQKHALPWYAPLLWTLFPIVYAAAILLRGAGGQTIPGLGTPYPYPFLDIQAHGLRCVLRNCALLLLGSTLFSGALLAITRLFHAYAGMLRSLLTG